MKALRHKEKNESGAAEAAVLMRGDCAERVSLLTSTSTGRRESGERDSDWRLSSVGAAVG